MGNVVVSSNAAERAATTWGDRPAVVPATTTVADGGNLMGHGQIVGDGGGNHDHD